MTGRAAAIALPAPGIGGVAADDSRVAGAFGQVIHLSQFEHLRHAAGRAERERAIVTEERLPVGGNEQDLAFARPSANLDVWPEPRHPPCRAAARFHQIDLGMLLVATDERDPFPVGGKARRRGLGEPGSQPARDAAGGADRPQIVVADENDRVAVQGRVAQVTLLAHGGSVVAGMGCAGSRARSRRRDASWAGRMRILLGLDRRRSRSQ
jgi:hypothetical protein